MRANDRIYVYNFLKDLNDKVASSPVRCRVPETLTCKELAKRCGVTPSTISNLTTSSSYFLLFRIAEEILDVYFPYYSYEESKERHDDPDCSVYPRDKSYIVMALTCYYSDEWLS